MKKEKCKCQYYDEVSGECGYHGCPVTPEMKEMCDTPKGEEEKRNVRQRKTR